MKNVKKVTWTRNANGIITVDGIVFPRGLVALNEKGTGVSFMAKCRDYTTAGMLKCFIKAYLSEVRQLWLRNSTNAAKKSNFRLTGEVAKIMSCTRLNVCNNKGQFVAGKVLRAPKGLTFRKIFKCTASMPLYKQVVEMGAEWSDPQVQELLNLWVECAVGALSYLDDIDVAIATAAESNVTEALAKAHERLAQRQAIRVNA